MSDEKKAGAQHKPLSKAPTMTKPKKPETPAAPAEAPVAQGALNMAGHNMGNGLTVPSCEVEGKAPKVGDAVRLIPGGSIQSGVVSEVQTLKNGRHRLIFEDGLTAE